ncbi:MAG: glycine--tRNA ligase subunit beta [Desulfonatronovibrionaceae bacterium]
MARFVLEIGTEEMPARFLPGLVRGIKQELTRGLEEYGLGFVEINSLATPRRISAIVEGLAERQKTEEKVFFGPPAAIAFDRSGAPTKAALGFARSQGVDVEGLFTRSTDKGEYLAVCKSVGGKEADELLREICPACISRLYFPKKMRWADRFAFGRPIRWLLAVVEDRVVPFTISDVVSGRTTRGHRVQGPGPFEIRHARDYEEILTELGGVVLDESARREIIREEGEKAAAAAGGLIVWEDGLLNEVSNLVEHPHPVLGSFSSAYLELPEEVLLTSMEKHQKSFGVRDSSGGLMPYFLTTLNLDPEDEDLVRRGWERVLKARLEDARFFWEADCRTSLQDFLAKLGRVVFMAGLGSMGDKATRLAFLGRNLAGEVPDLDPEYMHRAGELAKFDLVSEMVGEFDSLQGIMGGIYAGRQGEPKLVCRAIYEHYLPGGAESPVPQSKAGAVLALADKLDNLVGCFGLDMIPTGTADPYALRRQALGIMRIIMEHELELDLRSICRLGIKAYSQPEWKKGAEEILKCLMHFFADRLRSFWVAEVKDSKVVEAILGTDFSRLNVASKRLAALKSFTARKGFAGHVLTFKRADNIIRKQAETELDGAYDRGLFESVYEHELADKIEEIAPEWDQKWAAGRFAELLDLLQELKPYVDRFFDQVMVMTEDQARRVNRFNLLYALTSRLSRLADFSALQV